MSASTPWAVLRYEPPFSDGYGNRQSMTPTGEPQVFYMWSDVVEAVTLAIGPNELSEHSTEVWDTPAVFERDGVVILVYRKLDA